MRYIFGLMGLFFASGVLASAGTADGPNNMGLTGNPLGFLAIAIFVLAYAFVMVEEFIHLPKSKPVI